MSVLLLLVLLLSIRTKNMSVLLLSISAPLKMMLEFELFEWFNLYRGKVVMLHMSFAPKNGASISKEDRALIEGNESDFYTHAVTSTNLLYPPLIKRGIANIDRMGFASELLAEYSRSLLQLRDIVCTYIPEEPKKIKGKRGDVALSKQLDCIDSISSALGALNDGKSGYVVQGVAGHNDYLFYYIVDAWKGLEYHLGIGNGVGFEDLLEFHKERLSPELMTNLRAFNEEAKEFVFKQSPNPNLLVRLYHTYDAKLAVRFIGSPEARAKFLAALGSAGRISERESHNRNVLCPEMRNDDIDMLFIPGYMDKGDYIAQFPNKIMRDKFCAILNLHIKQLNGVQKIDEAGGCHIRITNRALTLANDSLFSPSLVHNIRFTQKRFDYVTTFVQNRYDDIANSPSSPSPSSSPLLPSSLYDGIKANAGPLKQTLSLTAISSIAAKVAYGLRLGATLSVAGAVFVGLQIMQYARNWYKSRQYRDYQTKCHDDNPPLNPTEVEAFNIGVKAAQSYQGLLFSFGSLKAYKHANAYYAGYQAAENHDVEMIQKVRPKQKVN